MTKGEIDELLLKHVFEVDPKNPPEWYLEVGTEYEKLFLCECWSGLGLVVEEMIEKDFLPIMAYVPHHWNVGFMGKAVYEDNLRSPISHVLIFMAVAIAALRAVGVEVEEGEVPK